ncbi:MAG: phosphoenolpyruvate--protein phosphotransferase [Thermodesulfobacteriota bacterium]
MRHELRGIAVCPGVALGKAVMLNRYKIVVEKTSVAYPLLEAEQNRFLLALEKSKEQIQLIQQKFHPKDIVDYDQILNFYIMMLGDESFCEEVLETIKNEGVNAEWAINLVIDKKTERLREIDDQYMQDRVTDLNHLGDRILRNLHGIHDHMHELEPNSVLVSHDISTIDVVWYAKHNAVGFATDVGGYTSHSAIVAKSFGIPSVMGTDDITVRVSPGDVIFIDGYSGTVVINPTAKELRQFKRREKEFLAQEKKLISYGSLPGQTSDGVKIKVNANIEIAEEVELALRYGAEGIGMYRTEFMLTNSVYFPTEEEQFNNYAKVVQGMNPYTVTIRTIDIGGDKFPRGTETATETNPALGMRGIRYSLNEKETFINQTRAMLKAQTCGSIRILIPMISCIEEIIEVKEIIEQVASDMDTGSVPELGVMIETPSAAILASELADEVDFLSIGTNDLIQYTLAVDRVNEHLSYLFSPFHPAILRLLRSVIEKAKEKNVPVGVCGEMASQLQCVPLIVGMGIEELSMNVHSIPKVKKLLSIITKEHSEEILSGALKLRTSEEIKSHVIEEIINRWEYSLPDEIIREISSS